MLQRFLNIISNLPQHKQSELEQLYASSTTSQKIELIVYLEKELNIKPKATQLSHLLKNI